ncbi:DEAD/DEAH box helicase [Microbacterium sp. PRC9]|uniref:DEAD/DEAH box helicase n=1 Tax=Microbacterium sp. PRC9 TaxID=2962591 RepID=UPI0028810B13|nr:DEAD/DEAH box helicase [Microbacterium sp. PRC9]MDT0141966.1 DEAD/DEAH box helicase [Microbacterium sp. PRC9]
MAKAEIALILRRTNVDRKLIRTAWYLHGIASVSTARERYTVARQRQAFLVSAHIFDLALARDDIDLEERLAIGFAAAIGYRRGGRDPNAAAIVTRLGEYIGLSPATLGVGGLEALALRAGLVFLGFDTKVAFRWLAAWRRYFSDLAGQAELDDLRTTALGPTELLVRGSEDVLSFLTRGSYDLFERGQDRLRAVVVDESAPLNERWVASHLLAFAAEAESGSPWNPGILPPEVPASVRQAFAIGSPAVLTFWEPQRELLTGTISPLDPAVRRMVLAVPTSGGKTLIAQVIAVAELARSDKSVCFVVPTRSLGREVRRAMSARVRILEKDVAAEKPDFPTWWETLDLPLPEQEPADVEVMTPERLSHLLRQEPSAVLERFGMFIFDEAQLLKEQGRGFVLESLIASLNLLTAERDLRIVLISAALGNAGAISQWLSPEQAALVQQSEWRGPRRLHAVFNTQADWESTVVKGGAGRDWPYRHTTVLSGEIRVRLATGATESIPTQGDTGWRLVRKSKDGAKYPNPVITDTTRSTKRYVIASQMIIALGHAGSVLVVASTKLQAQQLAQGIAASLDDAQQLAPLVDFVRGQLGDAHPLVATLRKGVGFHHAGLPVEVLEALEGAVRDDALPYLTCTSTLTDGVNLPVRTVVLYDTPYPNQPEDSRLKGARLVNAMGRAGRAGRETEGWIVLVRAAEPAEQDFADLNPDADDLEVTSTLTTDNALAAVAEFELTARAGYDAVFTAQGAAADFISFVWSMLATAEQLDDLTIAEPARVVDSTLAARHSAAVRRQYLAIAEVTRSAYQGTDPDARRRWARVGTSVGSARKIDSLARQVAAAVLQDDFGGPIDTAAGAVDLLADSMGSLLQLDEAPEWAFRTSVRGQPIEVDPATLLMGWLEGGSLPALADRYLAAAADPAWRIEQMVNVTTTQFEHYLSWTLGAVVELTNSLLESHGSEARVCPELAGYVRYGVQSQVALRLMSEGLHSRRISNLIAASLPADASIGIDDLRSGLGSLSVEDWRREFAATASEVADLLDFTRQRRRSLLKVLLDSGAVSLPLLLVSDPHGRGELRIEASATGETPGSLAVFEGARRIGTVGSQDQSDVQAILNTGFAIEVSIDMNDQQPELTLRLALDPTAGKLI